MPIINVGRRVQVMLLSGGQINGTLLLTPGEWVHLVGDDGFVDRPGA